MLASNIRALIAPVLRQCPHECGIVAITDVEVSPDCSYATVLISALKEPECARNYLESQRSRLQKSLSSLQLRKIPVLRFRIDPRTERGSRLDAILGG